MRFFLGLGSNLGDRVENLRAALEALARSAVLPCRCSWVYESAPLGPVLDQPVFLNLVLEVESPLPPRALLARLQEVETELGRRTGVPKGPRVIDIDLLLVEELVATWPELVLPHPEIGRRAFVLRPLLELEPDLRDPRSGRPLGEKLAAVQEQQVQRLAPLLLGVAEAGSIA